MEQQKIIGSFDAKALYVSYQVDKTMGHGVQPCSERIVARVVACSQAVVGGWAWTVSPSLPCAPIHRMCSMNSHPSPSPCFLLECTPPFPEWPGFPLAGFVRQTGRPSSHQLATLGFRELISAQEQPMVGSGDGREAGGWMVGGLEEQGAGMQPCWLKSGVELLGVWPQIKLSMVGCLSLVWNPRSPSRPHLITIFELKSCGFQIQSGGQCVWVFLLKSFSIKQTFLLA